MRHHEPAQLAAALERTATLPEGDEERFAGYGVMGAPFSSGDLLAMRRFPISSVGDGYTTVWHRAKNGDWTMYTDREPSVACPRYFGSALTRAIETPITVEWRRSRRMEVRVPAVGLDWEVELEESTMTRVLNAIASSMSDGMWRNPRVLATMSQVAAKLLDSGKLGLSGRTPNGQSFIANPTRLWLIRASTATIGGRDLGTLAPLPEQARLGDFWLPQRGLFAFGRAFFEPFDAARHRQVSQASRGDRDPRLHRAPAGPPT